jgi:hypothetical protein
MNPQPKRTLVLERPALDGGPAPVPASGQPVAAPCRSRGPRGSRMTRRARWRLGCGHAK